MKNITKLGLSALAGTLAATSVNAGDMSLSGSMEATYTTGGGYSTVGNPLGMDKELSVTGSGELDNGWAISYKQTITDAMAFNDSEMVVDTGSFGTIALTSTGSPISAIDDVTPTAFEEANALVGSMDDVNGGDGSYGIRWTLSDIMGSGMKADVMYFPKQGSGDATADNGTSGDSAGDDAWEYTLTGSIPMLPGLSFGAGYVDLTKDLDQVSTSDDIGQDEGTAYLKYAYGPVTVGYQVGAVSGKAAGSADYKNTYVGISYQVSDDFSVSYNEITSNKMPDQGASVEQDFDSISLSYSMGGMTLSLADSDCGNCSYTSARSTSATSVSMAVAF